MSAAQQQLPGNVAALLNSAASRYGVPAELARAVAYVESAGLPSVVSSSGAVGVMQLMPSTAAGLGVRDSFDAVQNIDGGVRLLRDLLNRFTLRQAIAAYNGGPSVAKKSELEWPAQTVRYVEKVLGRMAVEQSLQSGLGAADVPLDPEQTPSGRPRARARLSVRCAPSLSSSASPSPKKDDKK